MTKWVTFIGVILGACMLIAGCSSTDSHEERGENKVNEYGAIIDWKMPDGSVVQCAYIDSKYRGGLSCDWVAYHQRYAGAN